jgi:hypothetical protein
LIITAQLTVYYKASFTYYPKQHRPDFVMFRAIIDPLHNRGNSSPSFGIFGVNPAYITIDTLGEHGFDISP